ncbi:uracil-DNA glycosylase family protein [Desulfovermiculus halophilus]|uniref:uracil-DNA glycosylase family protein n=1 Tax=Desulfovermiculus halophilus TaxID=339722 RepID=UPI0004869412|nr:uracil-DNA glycosylase family protein [Desulfovermiculus halophilus]
MGAETDQKRGAESFSGPDGNQSFSVADFISLVKDTVQARPECRSCPLFGAPTVVLDTNRDALGPVDVAFLGLNPGREEVKQDRPFVGPAGRELRERMQDLPAGSTWLISNFILCHTQNEAAIPEPDQVLEHCLPMLRGIIARFPARLYVPLGAKAMQVCNISGRITANSGQVFKKNTIPLIHPSAILRASRGPRSNREIFDQGFARIVEFLQAVTK